MSAPGSAPRRGKWITHREITLPAAEAGPPASAALGGKGVLNTLGYDSVFFGVTFVGGTTPTAKLTIYARDPDVDLGQPGAWYKLGAESASLSEGDTVLLETYNLQARAVVTAVTGTPASMKVVATPGVMRGG
jgi:hypothetical protein